MFFLLGGGRRDIFCGVGLWNSLPLDATIDFMGGKDMGWVSFSLHLWVGGAFLPFEGGGRRDISCEVALWGSLPRDETTSFIGGTHKNVGRFSVPPHFNGGFSSLWGREERHLLWGCSVELAATGCNHRLK